MSLREVSLFNIQRDVQSHPISYSAVAIFAIGLIVFSTQMHQITALKGVNSHIFLGSGCGLVGLEILYLAIRNISRHMKLTDPEWNLLTNALDDNEYLAYQLQVNGSSSKYVAYKNNGYEFTIGREMPKRCLCLPFPVVKKILKMINQKYEAIPVLRDDALQKVVQPGEFFKFKADNEGPIKYCVREKNGSMQSINVSDSQPDNHREVPWGALFARAIPRGES